jgi:hypothetical protein
VPPGLLVRGAGEQDVAGEAGNGIHCRVTSGRPCLLREHRDHRELHGRGALHVDGAAAPDVAVRDVGVERGVRPAFRWSGDHIEVGQQQERVATGAIAAQPGGHRAAARERLDDLRPKAGILEHAGDEAGGAQLAVASGRVGRVDRRNADQLAQDVDEVDVRRVPARLVDGGRG